MRYYQKYVPDIDKWIKIDNRTGLIISVNDLGEFENIPKIPTVVEKQKNFWEIFNI